MAKKNPILAAHEAKLEAKYRKKLDITMQMCFDVACITANDVFHMGPGRAELFARTYSNNYANMCKLLMDDEDDPELTYSTSDIDRRLRSIVGEQNIVPWDERYGGVTP